MDFYSIEEVLIIHARNRAWEQVRNTIKKEADIRFTNKKGESALHAALWTRHVPVDVIHLLIHPNIINSFDRSGFTPLIIAAMNQERIPISEAEEEA